MPGLTAAVIGTGFVGGAHTEALRRVGVDVHGILGSSPEKSPGRKMGHNLDRRYDRRFTK